MRSRNEELLTAGAIESTYFMENIRAIQGIKLNGKEPDRISVWQNIYAEVLNAGIKVHKLGIITRFIHGLLAGTENIILMLLGGFAVLNHEITVGMVVAYISYKDQFYNRVFTLMDKIFEFKLLDVHMTRLSDIALAKPEKDLIGIGAPVPDVCLRECLQVLNVSFRYSKESPLLFKDVNLVVENEESVAIIGPTGCGKSTLVKIILSLLRPTSGEIIMHNVPIYLMGLSAYRERIAGVLQDDCLLTGSIFENICFFDPCPDRDRVEYAANLAGIAKDIRVMPMQYNTLVGNMGTALSGGQIQRILIARAFYKQPKLLILDEATSHLDLTTEKTVNLAVRQLNTARIIVAHRPHTIKLADRILELTPEGLLPVKMSDFDKRGFTQSNTTELIRD
jgi:ATP-binding cassette subfamily B protein RaxB